MRPQGQEALGDPPRPLRAAASGFRGARSRSRRRSAASPAPPSGVLPDGANAGRRASRRARCRERGLDARAMIDEPRARLPRGRRRSRSSTWARGRSLRSAMRSSAWRSRPTATRTTDDAHVMLPIAPFTETAGTFVNMEGPRAVVQRGGEAAGRHRARRGRCCACWARMLEPRRTSRRTRSRRCAQQIAPDLAAWARRGLGQLPIAAVHVGLRAAAAALERVAEFALYAGDPIVRRSRAAAEDRRRQQAARTRPLQRRDARARSASPAGDRVRVRQGGGEAAPAARSTPRFPTAAVRIARGVAGDGGAGAKATIAVEKRRVRRRSHDHD